MPSGPRKRKAARRKQQEQNTSDDRDTEKDSVSESYDEHDEDSPKTPGKEGEGHCGGAALDKDALSGGVALDKDALTQQTEEWLRDSSFDVGTPPPQTPTKLREGEFDDEDSSNSVHKTSNGTQGEETSNHAEPEQHGSSAAATGIPESSVPADDGDDQIQVNAGSSEEHGREEEKDTPAPQEFHCINTYQLNDGTVVKSEKHAAAGVVTSQPGDKVVSLSCKVHERQQVLPPPPAGCCGVLDWILGRSD